MDPEETQEAQKTSDSILDRVLLSQQAAAIESFVPSETFSDLAKSLSEKEHDILRRRFGLHGKDSETLEEIGKLYAVTRERIRQIENSGVQKILHAKMFRETIAPVERLLMTVLNTHGGVMEEQQFFQETLSHGGNTPQEQRALTFVLAKLLRHRFVYHARDEHLRACWKLKAQSLDLVRDVITELVTIVSERKQPISRPEFLRAFRVGPLFQRHATVFTDEVVSSYLHLSTTLSHNPFGEYGLTSWGTIIPKRMNDKIYVVLRKVGKPLHFTEIAKRINDAGFDHRRAYPPTVHNELILNSQYVLVGRGMYALAEWGYKPGVVADVLIDILKKENRVMTRDELVALVLQQRLVKRNTILLALTNKKLFQRLPSGSYELATKT